MKTLLFCLALFPLQDIPYKPKENFEVMLDYQFKVKPAPDHTQVYLTETVGQYERRKSASPLPYLELNVKISKLDPGEVRLSVTNNTGEEVIRRKKISEGMVIPLDVGFTDDVKDRVAPHEYTFTFLTADKTPVSRIVIFIGEDGTFLVNGEKRGRF